MTLPVLPASGENPWYEKRQAFDVAVKTALEGRLSATELADQIDDAITAALALAVADLQPAGDYALTSQVESFPVMCKWTGAAWQTLAGDAVPTDANLVRWYDSTPYATAGVVTPTHYSMMDKWYRKPA